MFKRFQSMFLAAAVALPLSAAMFPDPPKQPAPVAGVTSETAVLSGGCFWGMQGIFEHVKGVTATVVGYAGGEKRTAHYEMVSEGNTGHAESIQITYDPSQISYGQILKVFFGAAHDPTTLNRQHYDEGPQYRSAIFYSNEDQKKIAEQYIAQLNGAHAFRNPIVTQVAQLKGFYPAESEHQYFMERNPTQGYIMAVDVPLFENFRKTFPDLYRKDAARHLHK